MAMLTKGAGKRRRVATAISGAPPNAPPPAAETTAATEAPATSHSTAAATAKRKRASEVLSDAEEEGAETKDDAPQTDAQVDRRLEMENNKNARVENPQCQAAGSKGNHKKRKGDNDETAQGKVKSKTTSQLKHKEKVKAKTRREQLAEVINGEPYKDADAEAPDVAATDIDDDSSSEKDDGDEGRRL